jgi:subtilisin-like proprotein convertase family protein/Ca2+-binding RTX toxin-like protein
MMSEKINFIDLKANNFELVRAALTAADQVYGKTEKGFKLQPIDNSGEGRSQPWQTPPDWVIKQSIEDRNFGGKIVLYANEQTKQLMVVPMGTNGNADARGWYSNFKDYGLSQWRTVKIDENSESIKDKTYKAINVLLEEGYQGVIFPGDSKGGAQVQFIVHDIIEERNNGQLEGKKLFHLAALENHQIGIVAHNAPGIEAVLKSKDATFDPQSSKYDGIQTLYIVSKMEKNDIQELVSQTGGGYLANDGWVYRNELGVGVSEYQVKQNANAHVYLHRLSQSLYDGIAARGGDFADLPQVLRPLMSVNELAAFGGALASIGEGNSVHTLEAKARIGSAAVCAFAVAPLSATHGALRGEFGLQTVLGLSSLAVWSTGVGPCLALVCGVSVMGANGVKYLGKKETDIIVSNADLQSAINAVNAPARAPDGYERVFGHTLDGGIYVVDYPNYGVGGKLYCRENNIRSIGHIKNRAIDLSHFDSQTGKALGHGAFSCQPDGHLALTEAQFASATVAGQLQKLLITSSDDLSAPVVIKQVYSHEELLQATLNGKSDAYAKIFEHRIAEAPSPDLADYGMLELGVVRAFDVDNSRAPRILVNPYPEHYRSVAAEGSERERIAAGYIDEAAAYSVQYELGFLFDTRFTATQQASMASGGVRPGAWQYDPNPRPNDFLEKHLQFNGQAENIEANLRDSSLFNAAALSSLAANSVYQTYIDPILLDMTGHGVRMTEYTGNGVLFDMDHSGTLRRTGWAGPKTGILVDHQGLGKILSVSQLFSEYYQALPEQQGLAAKKKFTDGYAALQSIDSNQDGVIDRKDTRWSHLQVWVDANHNGQSEAGELTFLEKAGIAQISLSTKPAHPNEMRDGNRIRAYGSFILKGQLHEALSVEFIADPTSTTVRRVEKGAILTAETGTTTAQSVGDLGFPTPAPIKMQTYVSHHAQGDILNAEVLGVNHLYGGPGNDTLIAASTGSWLVGGGGSNLYHGGPGDDVLVISATDNSANIHGGQGTNTALIIGYGDTFLNLHHAQIHIAQGGPGNNVLVSGGGTAVYIKGGSGSNTLVGGAGDDVLVGGQGHNIIVGGTGKSIIYAGPNGDVIYGAKGNSIIHAGGGEDYIIAGPGNDVIEVGCGNAHIDGGEGTNIVQFHGSYGEYHIAKTAQGYVVTDKVSQRDGNVTLRHIHKLGFSDLSLVDLMVASPLPVEDRLYRDQYGQVFDRIRPHTIAADQLLTNDLLLASQAPLKVVEVSEAIGGSVSLSPTGDILFTPNSQFKGLMQFKYTICDATDRLAALYHSLNTGEQATLRAVVSLFTPDIPSDPLITQQWYLNDANILPVWEDYTGKSIRIAQFEPSGPFAVSPEILDYQHPDLAENIDPIWLAAKKAEGTLPTAFSNHATQVAGVMVAAKNGRGIIGVAPEAKIVAYPLDVQDEWTDLSALSYMAGVDVINHSWGISPDFLMDSPLEEALNIRHIHLSAVVYAASQGRGGLGSVMICATSNGRARGESAQGSPMNNNPFSIQVGTINAAGDLSTLQIAQATFSSPGASILISAPGSNIVSTSQRVQTERGSVFGKEASEQQGASFAAPIVSGIAALLLEANPHLGYRDVQHILLLSARQVNDKNTVWSPNHARYWNNGAMHTSHDYGFGAVDARAAVRLAETWLTKKIGKNSYKATEEQKSPVTLQQGKITSVVTMPTGLQIEHIDIDLDMTFSDLRDMVVTLISPQHTQSILLHRHGINPADYAKNLALDPAQAKAGSIKHRFMTTHDWGEASTGNWTLQLTSVTGQSSLTLHSWALHLYGSLVTVDDIYFYTDEYPTIAKTDAQRAILDDEIHGSAGGRNTFHAGAVSGNIEINLLSGKASLHEQSLSIKRPHEIHNIFTGDGNDSLVANHAGAVIDGGRGCNTLTGGNGDDIFVIHRRAGGQDTLINFNADKDKIYLVGFAEPEITLTTKETSLDMQLPNGQLVRVQNYAGPIGKVKPTLVIQTTLIIPGWYIDSKSEIKQVTKDSDTIVLSGGFQGGGVGGTSDSLQGFNWALVGKLYDHNRAKSNKFVVNALNNIVPRSNSDKLDYGNVIRGFKPSHDQIDLTMLGIQSADDLIIQRKEYGKFGQGARVVVIQGTEILSRSLGDKRGPAVLMYLDAIEPYQLTPTHFVFTKSVKAEQQVTHDCTLKRHVPLIFALSENASEFTPIKQSQVYRDWQGIGTYHHMAWTGVNQGFLAYDKNQDGTITDLNEIAFVEYLPGAQTDLAGLAAFDSNQDGQLDQQDTAWSQFGVWYDQNANGYCEAGEFCSLDAWQIQAISLQSDQITRELQDVTVFGIGEYRRQDQSKGVIFDAALHFEETSIPVWERHIALLTDNLITTHASAAASDSSRVFEEKSDCYLHYFSAPGIEKQGLQV